MALETIYRQKSPHLLTKAQSAEKLKKDSEYEIALQNLSTPFYSKKHSKKHSVGVSEAEEAEYKAQKSKLWNDYESWAIGYGLYETVTPEQQLAEVEVVLSKQITEVNLIRKELGLRKVQLTEVAKVG